MAEGRYIATAPGCDGVGKEDERDDNEVDDLKKPSKSSAVISPLCLKRIETNKQIAAEHRNLAENGHAVMTVMMRET